MAPAAGTSFLCVWPLAWYVQSRKDVPKSARKLTPGRMTEASFPAGQQTLPRGLQSWALSQRQGKGGTTWSHPPGLRSIQAKQAASASEELEARAVCTDVPRRPPATPALSPVPSWSPPVTPVPRAPCLSSARPSGFWGRLPEAPAGRRAEITLSCVCWPPVSPSL